MLSKRARYHYSDVAPSELKLIRVGHYLWKLYKVARNGIDVGESEALSQALETVWAVKRKLRIELAAKRAERSAAVREHFKVLWHAGFE
jgi:hypothetical protein